MTGGWFIAVYQIVKQRHRLPTVEHRGRMYIRDTLSVHCGLLEHNFLHALGGK